MFARIVLACAAVICSATPGKAAGQIRDAARFYHLAKTIKVAGEGRWGYLTADAPTRRLFVAHANHVVVIDMDNGNVVGEVANTPGVRGIAVAPELGRGFAGNGADSSVTIFDLKTLATIAVVKTGANPDAILFDPFSRKVFTVNGASQSVTAIDAASGALVGTVAIEGRPEFAQSDGSGHVYVNVADRSMVVSIDPASLGIEGRWPLDPCREPSGMAIDRAHGLLFIGCGNQMMAIFDTGNHRVLTTVPIGEDVEATAFDPLPQLAFSANGDGTLTIVHEDNPTTFRVVANVGTRAGARTMALDTKLHRVFTATASFGPPPAPTPEHPHPMGEALPGTFVVLMLDH